MKILVRNLALLILLFAFTTVQAQRGERNADPTARAKQQTEEMAEKLSLSKKQAEKVGEINLKYAQQMKTAREEMRNNENADWSSMRETMQTMRKEQNDDLKNIMTSAQFEKWEQIQQEQMKGRRGGREGGRPEGGRKGKGKKAPNNEQG